MKPTIVKLTSAIICAAIIFAVVLITPTVLHGAQNNTVMFYNDRAWTISRLPAEQVYSIYYVPISLFAQLPDVEVRLNDTLGTFIIIHGEYYLSFDTTSDFAANQDKERMYLKTAEYHNERYVPAYAVCTYLNLGCEELKNPVTGAVAIRITDANKTMTLKQLLAEKYPELFPETTIPVTTPPITTKPPTTTLPPETTSPRPVLSARTVYITVDNSLGKYTEEILEVLDAYRVKATFFVVGDRMETYAELLSRLAAGGHEIALHSMSEASAALTDAQAILSDTEAQNELLYKLIKQKSHIRRAPDGISLQAAEILKSEGCVLWDANVKVPYGGMTARAASNIAINGIWNNKTVILRFTEGQITAQALRYVLEFINENEDACEIRTLSPAFEEYNVISKK